MMKGIASPRPAPQQLFMFPRAPVVPALKAPVEIHGAAEISACGQYRWWLRRWWRAGPCVAWIMLNPSTADAAKNDPTLHQVVHFTRAWGYSGLVVVNLYPIRTPSPAACLRWAKMSRGEDDLAAAATHALHRNRQVILDQVAGADLVVAAWGSGVYDRVHIRGIEAAVREAMGSAGLHCLGISATGHPKHPLARGLHRIPRDQQPEPYPWDGDE
jgi:hypothetical protein